MKKIIVLAASLLLPSVMPGSVLADTGKPLLLAAGPANGAMDRDREQDMEMDRDRTMDMERDRDREMIHDQGSEDENGMPMKKEKSKQKGEETGSVKGEEMQERKEERKQIMEENKGEDKPKKGKKPWWKFWESDED
jgi:hypothetical protein